MSAKLDDFRTSKMDADDQTLRTEESRAESGEVGSLVAPSSSSKTKSYLGRAGGTTAAGKDPSSREPETMPKPNSAVKHKYPSSLRQCDDNQAIYERFGCLSFSARRQNIWVDLEAQVVGRDSVCHHPKLWQDGVNLDYWQSRAEVFHRIEMALKTNGRWMGRR